MNKTTAASPDNEKSLESWVWNAAYSNRGAKDAPKYVADDHQLVRSYLQSKKNKFQELFHTLPQRLMTAKPHVHGFELSTGDTPHEFTQSA